MKWKRFHLPTDLGREKSIVLNFVKFFFSVIYTNTSQVETTLRFVAHPSTHGTIVECDSESTTFYLHCECL